MAGLFAEPAAEAGDVAEAGLEGGFLDGEDAADDVFLGELELAAVEVFLGGGAEVLDEEAFQLAAAEAEGFGEVLFVEGLVEGVAAEDLDGMADALVGDVEEVGAQAVGG